MAPESNIGVVGLGRMGGTMAQRLLESGHRVFGTRRTREHAQPLIEQGLRWCDSPREVAEAADVVLSSVPSDDALNDVASGPDGILAGLAVGKTWLELSTVSPMLSRELGGRVRAQGGALLDAPVSGSVPQAREGALVIMVGGGADAYQRVEPLLQELGTPTHIGPNGQGLVMKLAINLNLAAQMLAFAEGLLLAERSGLDPKQALEYLAESPIGSAALKGRAPNILEPPDEAWFDVGMLRKDVELALDSARRHGLPLPLAERADVVLERAQALGYERRDIAALFRMLEELVDERAEA